ncbi:hypothetical protein Hanom_Chr12g01096791 [Helianthus anomalus]
MVGGVSIQPPQASQLAPEDEEFLKRNTDCVYFLASPLTCKKVIFFFCFTWVLWDKSFGFLLVGVMWSILD